MALDALVEAHFLSLKPNRFYARRAAGAERAWLSLDKP